MTDDPTGGRLMSAVMDVDGDGLFETDIGVALAVQGSLDTYQRTDDPFAGPTPGAASVVRVTSDLGGVCSRSVTID